MTTNELMRQLLVDIPDDDRRHLVEIVDRNHAEQLARKRRSGEAGPSEVDPADDADEAFDGTLARGVDDA